jgi:hypothetical protein
MKNTPTLHAPAQQIDFIPAETIDDVISRLQKIIKECEARNDRAGYFAALYYQVTVKVRDGIKNGEFQDGRRMERLDVNFANRYLYAHHQWQKNGELTQSWKTAFQATKKSSVLVLQHLLLGINAHINLDLGIATVETVGTNELQSIHQDFNTINGIIGSLTFEVISDINRVSPLLSLFGLHGKSNSILIQFSISNARDGAWNFAEELYPQKGADYDKCIRERDHTVKTLAEALITTQGLLRFTQWVIHLFEWRSPRKIIAVLFQHQKKYISFSGRKSSPKAKHISAASGG